MNKSESMHQWDINFINQHEKNLPDPFTILAHGVVQMSIFLEKTNQNIKKNLSSVWYKAVKMKFLRSVQISHNIISKHKEVKRYAKMPPIHLFGIYHLHLWLSLGVPLSTAKILYLVLCFTLFQSAPVPLLNIILSVYGNYEKKIWNKKCVWTGSLE